MVWDRKRGQMLGGRNPGIKSLRVLSQVLSSIEKCPPGDRITEEQEFCMSYFLELSREADMQ